MKDKRFRIGDEITFKFKNECGGYGFGGECQGGRKGIIEDYLNYKGDHDCWSINISFKSRTGDDEMYAMLESELYEYNSDSTPSKFNKRKIDFSY